MPMNDHSEIAMIQKRLENAIRQIRNLTASVGQAKQVRSYDSDRRKALLARYMLPYLKGGASAAAAEVDGRAEPSYLSEFEVLADQLRSAETTIAQWDAAYATFEASRSLLSLAKESLHTLDG
jgi:hypothetical protein